jgi:hypothetical protein
MHRNIRTTHKYTEGKRQASHAAYHQWLRQQQHFTRQLTPQRQWQLQRAVPRQCAYPHRREDSRANSRQDSWRRQVLRVLGVMMLSLQQTRHFRVRRHLRVRASRETAAHPTRAPAHKLRTVTQMSPPNPSKHTWHTDRLSTQSHKVDMAQMLHRGCHVPHVAFCFFVRSILFC